MDNLTVVDDMDIITCGRCGLVGGYGRPAKMKMKKAVAVHFMFILAIISFIVCI